MNGAKRKGDSAEREIAKILSDLLGIKVERKLGAGRSEDTGDLYGLPDTTAQVKNYADVTRAIREGLEGLERQQANAGTTHGVVFVRRKGGKWFAAMPIENYVQLLRGNIWTTE